MELFQFADYDADTAFTSAEEHFAQTRALPPIDKSLWSFDVQVALDLSPRIAWPGADELLASLPPHEATNPIHRAAIANLIYHVCDNGGHFREQQVEWLRDFLPALRRYLAFRDPVTVDDMAVLRWELHAAAGARDLERMLLLASQWPRIDKTGEHYAVVPRTLFSSTWHCEGPPHTDEAFTTTSTLSSGNLFDEFYVGNMLNQAMAAVVPAGKDPFETESKNRNTDWNALSFARRMSGTDLWSYLPADEGERLRREAVRTCAAFLQLLGPARVQAFPDLGLIDAWCAYAVARFDTEPALLKLAGEKYRFWAGGHQDAHSLIFGRSLEAAGRCYLLAGCFDDAEEAIRKWVATQPDSAMAHRRLSEVLYKQDRPLEAREAFESFVRLGAESSDEEWSNSLLLRLGLEAADKHHVARAIEAAANTASWRQPGQTLLAWFAPWTRKLSTLAANRWWVGLYTLAMPSHRNEIGEAEVWSQAADAFGEAVAMELRATVFAELKSRPSPSAQEREMLGEPWVQLYQDRATLGQSLDALLLAGRSPSLAAKELKMLLEARRPLLLRYLRAANPRELKRLNEGRKAGQHHSAATEVEARIVFEEASKLLTALHKDVVKRPMSG